MSVKEMEELRERAKRALDVYQSGETLLARHFREEMKALMAKVERGELGRAATVELTENNFDEGDEDSPDE